MNFVFWLFLVFVAVFMWFLLSFIYKPIGKYLKQLFNEAQENMKD